MSDFEQRFDGFFGAQNKAPDTASAAGFESRFDAHFQEQAQADGRIKAAVDVALQTTPEQAAQQKYLSNMTGIPMSVVQTAEGRVKAIAKLQELQSRAAGSPVLRAWLQNPDFTTLAQNDGEALSGIEKVLGAYAGGIVGDFAGGTVSGFGKLYDISARALAAPLIAIGGDPMRKLLTTPILPVPSPSDLLLNRPGQALKDIGARMKPGAAESTFATDVAGGLGQITGQIGSMIATGGMGSFAQLFAQGTDAMADKVAKDDATQAEKDTAALLGASVTAITEKYALDKILGPLAVPIKNAVVAAVARIGVAAAAEGGQEMAENIGQDIVRKLLTNPDAQIDFGDAAYAGGVGATVGGVVRSLVEAALHVRARGHQQRIQQTTQEIANLQEMLRLASGSDLLEKDPQTFKEYVQAVADGTEGAPKSVWVDGRVLQEALAQSGVDPQTIATLLPSVQSQLAEGAVANSSVEIPIGELATAAGTPLEQALTPHLRMSADGLSLTEAKQEQEQAQQFLQENADRIIKDAGDTISAAAQRENVRQIIAEQLNATGRYSKDVADKGAKLVGDFYTVMAQRLGTTPDKLYGDLLQYKVQAQGQGGLTQEAERMAATPEFQQWFGKSKVVDTSGKPMVMYHGTTRDISTLDPNASPATEKTGTGATFLSPTPDVANDYASGTGGNVMPVYVNVENPFDYNNPEHIAAIEQYEKDNRYTERSISYYVGDIKRGNWEAIESRKVQAAIKAMGHDGFYVEERGSKNLAVYNPETQIKSIFNQRPTNAPGLLNQSFNDQAEQLTSDIEAAGNTVVDSLQIDQLIDSKDIPTITLQDLVGLSIFPTIADRTAAAALYTGIDSSRLDVAIPLLGGPFFPLRESNVQAGVVWANRGDGVIAQKAAKLKEGANYMLVVMGDANMHQSNSTVAAAFMGTLEAWARDGRISATNVEALGRLVRETGAKAVDDFKVKLAQAEADMAAAADEKALDKAKKARSQALKNVTANTYLENFPGFDDVSISHAYMDGISFDARKRILEIMASKQALDLGAPPMQKILDATREPSLAGHRWGDGVLLVEVDQTNPQVELGTEGTTHHPDFPVGVRGRVVGKLNAPISWETLWQDWLRENADKASPRRAFELAKPIVTVTQELIDRIGPITQANIDGARQARLAADFAAGNWRTSDDAVNKGGVSPQEFIDALMMSDAKDTLTQYTLDEIKAGIKDGTKKIYQLGSGQIYFLLETRADGTKYLASVVNNERGARGIGAPAVVLKALEEGATDLDCFAVKSNKFPEGFLPSLYAAFGFEVSERYAFDPQYFQPQLPEDQRRLALADAVNYWQTSTPGFDPQQGMPDAVVMKWKGTENDRREITQRYLRSGLEGLLEGRTSSLVAEFEAEFGSADRGQAGEATAADGGRVAGDQGAGAGASIASRARGTVQAIASLTDNELANLGLGLNDRAAVRHALGQPDVRETLAQSEVPNKYQTAYLAGRDISQLTDEELGQYQALSDNPSTVAQSETEAFKRWFGDSKVVDADGKPLVMYHATTADFDTFDTTRRAVGGEGSWFSARPVNSFAGEEGGNIMPVYLSLQNPKVIDLMRDNDDVLKQKFIEQGHDGVVMKRDGKIITAVAFYPEQIKSAIGNNGQFDSNNPNILKQGGKGPRGTYDIASMTTVLNGTADLSTFLHETGHFFLDAIRRMVLSGNATPEVQAMYEQALKGLNVTPEQWEQWHEDYATSGKISDGMRAAHERWAESFELYLFTGKSPNPGTQSLFRTFAEWLKRVYTSMEKFAQSKGLTLDADLKAVMDKMLATDEQIAEAEAIAGLLPDLDATGEAREKLNARSMRDLQWARNAVNKHIAKLQKEARGLRAEIEEEVRAELAKQPVFAALRFIKKGEATVDGEEIKATTGHKINTDALKEMYPETMLARPDLTKLKGLTNKEGLHPDVLADSFGFPSGDALIRALIEANLEAEVEGMTDQRMLERHGDLATPEAIAAAAVEAVHNEARAKSLATELAAQREMLNPRRDTGEQTASGAKRTVNVLVEAAKAFAQNVIGRRAVKDLKKAAWAHLQAERRAGKAWEQATAAGDTQAAVQAKQDQMLNNAAVRAANEAQSNVRAALDLFKKISKGNNEQLVKRGLDPDIVNAARAILAAYGVTGPQSKSALEYLELVQKNDPAMYAAIQPSVLGALTNAKPFNDLTVAEVEALKDEIESLWHLAKRSRQMEIDGNLLDREDVQDELHADLEARGIPDEMPGDTSAITPQEQAMRMLMTGTAANKRVESWAQGMGAQFTKFVFQPVKEAADRYRAAKAEKVKALHELLKPIAGSLKKGNIDAPELGYTFGKDKSGVGMAEVLHAIIHTGNESNKRKLLLGREDKVNGGFWAKENEDGTLDTSKWDAFIARMVREGKLTQAHYDFAQGVWDLFESTKPLAQKTHRDVFGRYFAEVTADAFVDPFGVTRRGGYAPAIVDSRIVTDAASRKLAETENESMSYAFPSTSKGFTKSRVEYNKPLLLDLRVISQHMDKVLLFSYMEPPVRDVRRVLMAKNVSYGLNRIDPVAFDNVITPWLNGAALQQVEAPIAGDAGLSRLLSASRSRSGMSMMFGHLANAAQQLTGFSLAAVKVKPTHLISAAAQMVAHPKQMKDRVAAASVFMKERLEGNVHEAESAVRDILLDPNVYQQAVAWNTKHAYFLQQAVDNAMSPAIWTAAFNQAVEQGLDDKDAVRFADSVIRTTQGSNLPEDIPRIARGNAFVRMFTQFADYFNMQANLLGTEFGKVAREMGVKQGAGKMLYIALLGFLAPAWVGEAIMQAFRGGPDDEDKDGEYLDDWIAAVFGWSTVRGASAMIPAVGPVINAGVNSWNDKPYDDRISTAPAISMIESMVRSPSSVYKAVVEDGSRQKAVRDVGALLSLAGLPVAGLAARPLGYLAGMSDNRINPTSGGDMARGLATGYASPQSK